METNSQTPTGPGEGHRRLQVFVGRWETAGEVRATAEAPAFRFTATDTYEWMAGGFFLLHHVDAAMGDTHLRALEIVRYDAETDTYPMQSYDSQGGVATHTGVLDGRAWRIVGETERFAGEFDGDGRVLRGTWERSEDGEAWEPWMDITLTRAD
jgi:Protein of unknown function (DUF1579)